MATRTKQGQDLVVWLAGRPLINPLTAKIELCRQYAQDCSDRAMKQYQEYGGLYGIDLRVESEKQMWMWIETANRLQRKLNKTVEFYVRSL